MTQRPVETPEQWATRVLAEHGPPPRRVVERINQIRRRVQRRTGEPS